MPRYEFSEGPSNKFWEINLSGKSFTTTYGKIGTPGQTTIKQFGSDADAKKEHDKLVAEKTKKGYELVAGSKAAKAAPAAPAKATKATKATPATDDDDDNDDDDGEAAPKKKAAAAAKPAAKPTPAKAAKGARYFEFSEGSSNKFWEITLAGTDVKTRYGKIGTPGQQTLKEFGDAAGAKKEYDKLIAEKTKKGYEEGNG